MVEKRLLTKTKEVSVEVKRAARFPNPVIEMPVINDFVDVGKFAKVFVEENTDTYRLILEFKKKDE